jgi:hypothetical protein
MVTSTWRNDFTGTNAKNEVVKANAEKAAILAKIFNGIGKVFSETGEAITKPEAWEKDEAGQKFYTKMDANCIYENN